MRYLVIPIASIGLSGLVMGIAAAQHLPASILSAHAVESLATPGQPPFRVRLAASATGQDGAVRPSPGGCLLAEFSLGLAGEILGSGASAAVTDVPGLPLLLGAVGAVAGIKLGSYAGRCRVSHWGSAVGAGILVLLGATAGHAFDGDRTEADDWDLAAVYLFMVPLAWVGGQVPLLADGRR